MSAYSATNYGVFYAWHSKNHFMAEKKQKKVIRNKRTKKHFKENNERIIKDIPFIQKEKRQIEFGLGNSETVAARVLKMLHNLKDDEESYRLDNWDISDAAV